MRIDHMGGPELAAAVWTVVGAAIVVAGAIPAGFAPLMVWGLGVGAFAVVLARRHPRFVNRYARWIAAAWIIGAPIGIWVFGQLWSLAICETDTALCAGGMQWLVVLFNGFIGYLGGILTIAAMLAVVPKKSGTPRGVGRA